MVKLTTQDKEKLSATIAGAEATTSAEIICVVAPASGTYNNQITLLGLMLGSIIATILWETRQLVYFPWLLLVQLGIVTIISLPWWRRALLMLVPKHILQDTARRAAGQEYLNIEAQVAHDVPYVLLYMSLAERYVHILPNAVIRAQLSSDQWADIVKNLITEIKHSNAAQGCALAITQIGAVLAAHFPDDGGPNKIGNAIIEIN